MLSKRSLHLLRSLPSLFNRAVIRETTEKNADTSDPQVKKLPYRPTTLAALALSEFAPEEKKNLKKAACIPHESVLGELASTVHVGKGDEMQFFSLLHPLTRFD